MKNKVGRPCIGKEPREKMVYCRVSDSEFDTLHKIAESRGKTMSALFREAVEKHLLKNQDLQVLLDNMEQPQQPPKRKAFVDFEDLKAVTMADGTEIAPRSLKAKRKGTGAKW